MFASSYSPLAASYQEQLEYAVYIAAQEQQQLEEAARRRRLHQQRQAEMAYFAAAVEQERRRQRRLAIERLVAAQEAERRRRLQEQQAQQRAVEEALAYRAAVAAELARRRAAVEAARVAAYVAREQHRCRQEAELEQRRRAVEARRARQRQFPVSQALVEVLIELAMPGLDDDAAATAPLAGAAGSAPTAPPHPSDETATVVESQRASSTFEPAPPQSSPPPASSNASASPAPSPAEPVDASAPAPTADETTEDTSAADRQAALDSISALRRELESHQSAFTSPSILTFQPSPTADSTPSTPPLAYGKSNTAFLAYEDYLVSLLSKIDAIESHGDEAVKQARKELVRHVEKELDRLDELKDAEWERQSQQSAAASSPAHSDDEDEPTEPNGAFALGLLLFAPDTKLTFARATAPSDTTEQKTESDTAAVPVIEATAEPAPSETASFSTEPQPTSSPTGPAEVPNVAAADSADVADAPTADTRGPSASSSSRPASPRPRSRSRSPSITAFAGVALPSIFDTQPIPSSPSTAGKASPGGTDDSAETGAEENVEEAIKQADPIDPAPAPLDSVNGDEEQRQVKEAKTDAASEADTEEFIVV